MSLFKQDGERDIPDSKSTIVWKKLRLIFVLSALLICSLILYAFFSPTIKTIIWHVKHPNPISWNKLKVSIPENLVAHEEESLNMLLIYSFISPGYGISFERATESSFRSLIEFFRSEKYFVENISCKVLGENCLWIKATNEDQKINYTEEIFIIDRGIRISFKGSKEQRVELLWLIENLKFAKE